MSAESNTTHRRAKHITGLLMAAKGWSQHESNGWTLAPIGSLRDDDPNWIRAMCEPPHAPPGWTIADEIARFSMWLGCHGWKLDRVSIAHEAHFRLIPGPVHAPHLLPLDVGWRADLVEAIAGRLVERGLPELRAMGTAIDVITMAQDALNKATS